MNYISQNIKYLCERDNVNFSELATEIKAAKNVVSMWAGGKSTPKIDAIQAIGKYFRVSLEDFINSPLSEAKQTELQIFEEPKSNYNIKSLQNLLEHKDKIILLLEEQLGVYRNNAGSSKQTG